MKNEGVRHSTLISQLILFPQMFRGHVIPAVTLMFLIGHLLSLSLVHHLKFYAQTNKKLDFALYANNRSSVSNSGLIPKIKEEGLMNISTTSHLKNVEVLL